MSLMVATRVNFFLGLLCLVLLARMGHSEAKSVEVQAIEEVKRLEQQRAVELSQCKKNYLVNRCETEVRKRYSLLIDEQNAKRIAVERAQREQKAELAIFRQSQKINPSPEVQAEQAAKQRQNEAKTSARLDRLKRKELEHAERLARAPKVRPDGVRPETNNLDGKKP